MRLWPRAVDDRGKAYAFDVSTVQSWRDRAVRRSGVPLVLAFIAAALGFSVLIGLHGRVPHWLRYTLVLAAMGPWFYLSAAWTKHKAIRESDRLARARGLCPACGYSIAELEPEADECRVCPECGSAWRLEAGVTTGDA
ncbi:MAG: hypothetical protein RIB58_02145 [Phycisphaerales bacterium]